MPPGRHRPKVEVVPDVTWPGQVSGSLVQLPENLEILHLQVKLSGTLGRPDTTAAVTVSNLAVHAYALPPSDQEIALYCG